MKKVFLFTILCSAIGCSSESNNTTQTNNGHTSLSNNGSATSGSNNGTTNNGVSNNGVASNNNTSTQSNNLSVGSDLIHDILDEVQSDADFALLVEADNGMQLIHSVGEVTPSTSFRSASTSKWVSAAVILSVVQSGALGLDDNPQDHINGWPTNGNLSEIKLRHLLSFTSGLSESPLCVNLPRSDFDECVLSIVESNPDSKISGSEFYYASTHLQVAGAMAIRAAGFSTWSELFADFKTKTGLFPTGLYDLPSESNPRLAGGMHWTGEEYFAFLRALYRNEILTPSLIEMMTSDQNAGVAIEYSPANEGTGEDWHYGFGNWIECHSPTFNCSGRKRVSSAGAYGAYPFIDFEHKYFGIVAREGQLGTFVNGYEVFNTVSSELETWASENKAL